MPIEPVGDEGVRRRPHRRTRSWACTRPCPLRAASAPVTCDHPPGTAVHPGPPPGPARGRRGLKVLTDAKTALDGLERVSTGRLQPFGDTDSVVRQAVAFNGAGPRELLVELPGRSVDLTILVAMNPGVPRDVLDALAQDSSPLVRFVASGYLQSAVSSAAERLVWLWLAEQTFRTVRDARQPLFPPQSEHVGLPPRRPLGVLCWRQKCWKEALPSLVTGGGYERAYPLEDHAVV